MSVCTKADVYRNHTIVGLCSNHTSNIAHQQSNQSKLLQQRLKELFCNDSTVGHYCALGQFLIPSISYNRFILCCPTMKIDMTIHVLSLVKKNCNNFSVDHLMIESQIE